MPWYWALPICVSKRDVIEAVKQKAMSPLNKSEMSARVFTQLLIEMCFLFVEFWEQLWLYFGQQPFMSALSAHISVAYHIILLLGSLAECSF